MSLKQANEILRRDAQNVRNIIDNGGWSAIRNHPVYGPVWQIVAADMRQYEAVSG